MTIYASSYGAVGNGTTDDTVALQNAINAAQAASDTLELAPGKTYRITSALIVQQGRATSSGAVKTFDFDGKNSKIVNGGTGFAIEVVPLSTTNGANAAGDVSMRNFELLANTGAFVANSKKGIKIGRDDRQIYCLGRPKMLQNVLIHQLGGSALEVINTAHVDFERVTQRDDFGGAGHGLTLHALGSGKFCGDLSFYDCQFQGTSASGGWPFWLSSWAGTGQAQLRGVRFDRCVFYGTGSKVEASTGSQTNDIWFHDCAWDGPSGAPSSNVGTALRIEASQNGQIDKLYFDNPYITQYTAAGVHIEGSGTFNMSDVHFRGGSISMTYRPFYAKNSKGWYLDGVAFTNNQNQEWCLINVDTNNQGFKIDGCTESNNSGGQYFIGLGAGGSNNFHVSNNTSYTAALGVVYDYAGSVTKVLYNNVDI